MSARRPGNFRAKSVRSWFSRDLHASETGAHRQLSESSLSNPQPYSDDRLIITTKKKHDWLSKRSAYDDDAGASDDRSCSADDDDRVVLLKIPSSAGQYYMLAVVTTPFALGNASVKYAPGNGLNTLLAMKEQPSIINERVLIAPLRSVPNIRYTHDGTTESWLENNNAGGEDQGIKTYIGLTSAVPGLLVLPWLVRG